MAEGNELEQCCNFASPLFCQFDHVCLWRLICVPRTFSLLDPTTTTTPLPPPFLSPGDKERGRENVGSGQLWTTKRSIKFTTPQFLSANPNRKGERVATAGQAVAPPHYSGPPADVSFRPRSHPNRPIPRWRTLHFFRQGHGNRDNIHETRGTKFPRILRRSFVLSPSRNNSPLAIDDSRQARILLNPNTPHPPPSARYKIRANVTLLAAPNAVEKISQVGKGHQLRTVTHEGGGGYVRGAVFPPSSRFRKKRGKCIFAYGKQKGGRGGGKGGGAISQRCGSLGERQGFALSPSSSLDSNSVSQSTIAQFVLDLQR